MKVRGLEQFLINIQSVSESLSLSEVSEVLEQVLKDVALPVARDQVPVDKGALKRSLFVDTIDRGKFKGYVQLGSRAHHANLQELGTVHHAAQPFLYPSVMGQKDRIYREVLARLKNGKLKKDLKGISLR